MVDSASDERRQGTDPIAEAVIDVTLLFATNDTTITKAFGINGTIMDMFLDTPDCDGTKVTCYITTPEGRVFYDSGEVDDNKLVANAHHLQPGVSVRRKDLIKIVTTTQQTANRTFRAETRHA